ncbi:Fe-S cluster assembly sulfur transfer protein SufU [Marinicella gelatinilytica]|uniref:Fe-S cluster assembly sulfur transfer protein SufU n=1 Tax=Marinicella gelatinilytica TaxID=2996017 RepID=UPI002261012F|nr:SUF system NifU family Fe-S cluster assembly protein [Marinicella gelatinilytica]MCX7545450.1 SUF system NifU family Fe-S cluster assembly protein [Marinicella gelatinilytica]
MSDLNKLYKQQVLEHNKNPKNYGQPAHWTHHAEGLNAICGDQVHVYLTIQDNTIEAAHFAGDSCAISMASASMMTELITGQSTFDALHLFASFKQMMSPEGLPDAEHILGPVACLVSVKKFPSRIKSALLCWYALNAALNGQATATTE